MLFEVIAAILFVASAGLLFNERFRKSPVLVVLAGVIALISTYYLTVQISEDITDRRIREIVGDRAPPSTQTREGVPAYLAKRRSYENLRTEPLEWETGVPMNIERGLALTFSKLGQRTGDNRRYHVFDKFATVILPQDVGSRRGFDLVLFYGSPKRFGAGPEALVLLFDTKNGVWRPILFSPAAKVEFGATFTNGMRDLVLDSKYIYTWGGDGYYTTLDDGTLPPIALPEEWRTPSNPSTAVETTTVPTLATKRVLGDADYQSMNNLPAAALDAIAASYARKDCGGVDDQSSMLAFDFARRRHFNDPTNAQVFAEVRLSSAPCTGDRCFDGLILKNRECATSVIACSFNIIHKQGSTYRVVALGQGFAASILPTQRNGMHDVDLGYSVVSWDGACYRESSGL